MKNKTPWYIYPPEEPKKHHGEDALGVLVGLLLVMIVVLVALDHVVYGALAAVSNWWNALGIWPGN